jgi:hypothetical protein
MGAGWEISATETTLEDGTPTTTAMIAAAAARTIVCVLD